MKTGSVVEQQKQQTNFTGFLWSNLTYRSEKKPKCMLMSCLHSTRVSPRCCFHSEFLIQIIHKNLDLPYMLQQETMRAESLTPSLHVWFIVSKNLFVVAGSAFARENGTDEECVLLLDVFFVKNIFLKMASVESLALDACLTSHRTI